MKTPKTNPRHRPFSSLYNQAIIAALLLPLLGPELGRCQAPVIPDEVKANIMMRVTNGFNPAIVVGVVNSNGSTFFSCGVRDLDTSVHALGRDLHRVENVDAVIQQVRDILHD